MAESDQGPFETILGIVGLFLGIAIGSQAQEYTCGAALILGIILAGIGAFIGKQVDAFVTFVIAVVALIVIIAVNATIRHFVFELIRGIIQAAGQG